LRLAYFPAIARRVPELRRTLFFGRLFITRRSAAFDLAVAGLAVAMVKRRPLPLVAALPYAASVGGYARRWRSARVGAVEVAADAVGLGALAWGSARSLTLVL
jgi:hypothetical protein